jgi:GTPase-associated protein 1, N-terminal domain type 1
MAHGVTTATIVLHQALHGYADGHRLLASSIALKPRDAKVVATLSDASGSTANLGEAGYITGYPLPDAGLYALAKTWPAPEMPRPGCVWTHTLLLDFADLAAIQDLAWLAQTFVRPAPGIPNANRYGVDVSFPSDGSGERALVRPCATPEVLRRLLWALYGRPGERVFSTEGEPEERESITLALWSQQWPRLRRSFRFCTQISSDRSSEGAPFDLQFGSKDERSHRGRTGKLFDADREQVEGTPVWLEETVCDLLNAGALRGFLRGVGAEVEGGRDVFEPLAELHGVLYAETANAPALRRGVDLIEGPLKVAEARDARMQLMQRLAAMEGELDEVLVTFSMRNLPLMTDDQFAVIAPRLGAALWRYDPHQLVKTLASGGRAHALASTAIAAVPTEAILTELVRFPDLAPPVLGERPALLSEPSLWGVETLEQAARAVLASGLPAASVLDAAIGRGTASIVRALCEAWGRDTVLTALIARLENRGSENPTENESRWLAEAATPNTVAATLSRSDSRLQSTLVALARQLRPDDVPNDYGEDPVYTAIRQARGELSPASSLYLRAWVLARALGYRSSSQAELFAFSFDQIYLAALGSRLPDEAWNLLDGRLPNSMFWSDWDRGRRLRAGILIAFIERDLDARTFGRLLPASEAEFGALVSEASSMWGGRGYLRQVKRALREADSYRYATRIAYLNRVV